MPTKRAIGPTGETVALDTCCANVRVLYDCHLARIGCAARSARKDVRRDPRQRPIAHLSDVRRDAPSALLESFQAQPAERLGAGARGDGATLLPRSPGLGTAIVPAMAPLSRRPGRGGRPPHPRRLDHACFAD